MPTFKLKTLGCKVNQYDSQALREELLRQGYSEENNGRKADLYLINTCTVTARSDAKSLSLIREALRENPKAKILVAGCFVKAEGKRIKRDFGRSVVLNDISNTFSSAISGFAGHSRAFLKIQDGCDNCCAYCRVPLVRGKSHSRNLKSVEEEAKMLLDKGFKELVLCGICLGAYGKDLKGKINLGRVISSLIAIKADFRIRLSSIEAKDVTSELVDVMAQSNKLCPHLHIPFQSGDDSVLKHMARKYTVRDYLDKVAAVRRKIPLAAITTDILVGFPGETERNFQNTLKFLKTVRPSRIHAFPFSPRPGTAAFNFSGMVSEAVKDKRMARVLALAKQLSTDYRRKFINRKLAVLIEARLDKKTGFFRGYSENYIYTLIRSNQLFPGQVVQVKAASVNPDYLIAKIAP